MRKSIFLLVLILVIGLAGCSKKTSKLDQVRTWTTTDGETLQASWDRTDESNPDMICLVSNGEKYDIDIKDLSDDDQEYIQQKRSKFRKREKATSVNTKATKTKDKKSLNPEELFQLGEKWATADHGKGTQDWDKALKYYRQAAELGHSGAMVQLGECYLTGIGVKKDESEGIKWICKAADIGNPFAFAFMVYISHDETWLQRCFQTCNAQKDSNDPAIQFLLGLCYCGGEGVKQDETEGIKWIRKSADQGYAKAQFRLGQYYEFDKKDAVEAIKWYLKAAKQGDVQAQHHLADCYADGTGVEKDMTEAVKWGRKCAEQGMAKAQRELGFSYEHGEGVEKNIAEAIKWYRKAAEQGDAYAQRALERLEK